jgi:putative transcriptional regulator
MAEGLAKGTLLVALPTLLDPNFRQSVVLLCDHGSEGSLGLVLNRPARLELSGLIREYPTLAGIERVFVGGPVAVNHVLVLYRGGPGPEDHSVFTDVFLAKNLEALQERRLFGQDERLRCFLGYAGWAPGQLEAEMKTGAWHLFPADPSLIFHAEPVSLWSQMMRRIGGKWAMYAGMPPDPNQN